ncbi:hypothetical protein CYY_008254 [Polysphondylium violaceum]|uniref:Uncharacterized protein n=1 Tax=Polysphondylium violaceum TaxID=133409 RepID=A0A8J4UQA5_9MYCE|nr:hypothetical protein CYY_008254 [Polysphondylium violaceum]
MSIFSALSSISNPTKSLNQKSSTLLSSNSSTSIGSNKSTTWIITSIGGPSTWYPDGKNEVFFGTIQQFLDSRN